MDDLSVRRGICFLCWAGCGILAYFDGDDLLRIEGDPACPYSHGWMCERASKVGTTIHHHPQRLNHPLKRAGQRGEGQWQRISWEQAVGEIAAKLADIKSRFGPEAILSGGGTGHGSGADWCRLRFMNLLGSPNSFYQGINCGASMIMVQSAMFGAGSVPSPVPGVTKAMVLWGYNPAHSWMTEWLSFLAAKREGGTLVVIDPRFTETAMYADEWLRIRPGTDGALALGIINVLVSEGIYDHDFVENWTLGFEELAYRAEKYTPERVAEITWVPAHKIVKLAHLYAENRPVCQFGHLNISHLGPASQAAIQYLSALPALTGNLQVLGGTTVGGPVEGIEWNELIGWERLIRHPERSRDVVGADKYKKGLKVMERFLETSRRRFSQGHPTPAYMLFPPLRAYWDAILEEEPYPIKAALFQGTNIIGSCPNNRRVYQALKSPNLELLVTMDLFMNPTAMLSDYVLPATDFLERPELYNLFGLLSFCFAAPRLCKPLFERHDDYELWRDLGKRLGQDGEWPDSLEAMFTRQLRPLGVTFEQFVAERRFYSPGPLPWSYKERDPVTGAIGFATPSGKVELMPSLLAAIGADPLPPYREPVWSPVSSPELAQKYPLILITGSRTRIYQLGEHRQFPALRRLHPWPRVEIHPETARKLDIVDGEWVWVETPLGRVRQRARVTEAIDPRVVNAEAYWWFPEREGCDPELFGSFECNVNAILPDDDETIGIGGDNYLRALLCRVYRDENQEPKEVKIS